MVAMTGVFLSLTRDRKVKIRPSFAMAKIMRGSGNMEPSRLHKQGREDQWIYDLNLNFKDELQRRLKPHHHQNFTYRRAKLIILLIIRLLK